MSNTIKKTQDILSLKLETKAFKYIEITDQIRQLTKIRTVLKDELVPIVENFKEFGWIYWEIIKLILLMVLIQLIF